MLLLKVRKLESEKADLQQIIEQNHSLLGQFKQEITKKQTENALLTQKLNQLNFMKGETDKLHEAELHEKSNEIKDLMDRTKQLNADYCYKIETLLNDLKIKNESILEMTKREEEVRK